MADQQPLSRRSRSDLRPAPDGYPIKLVRDGTQAVLNDSGEPGDLFYGPMPEGFSREEWLKRKLGEEVTEYLIDGGMSELLDVLAVLEALFAAHRCDFIWAIEQMKRHPRGGFREAVMMYGRHREFDNA